MILKPASQAELPTDPRLRAGARAERQMAHYLDREFANDPSICVLHDLRVVDPEQPEHGSPGVCQIDHLVVHRHGMFIVESKSVHEAVEVQDDGTGHDEWLRVFKGKASGMPSPIQQATRQAKLLRAFLQRHTEQLLGKMPLGARTLAKLLNGTDQRGFRFVPIQIMVAIGDQGRVDRGSWKPPEEPFQVFVSKADNVPSQIRQQIDRHRSADSPLALPTAAYGRWSMKQDEVSVVAQFLADNHTPIGRRGATARATFASAPSAPSPPMPITTTPTPPPAPTSTPTPTPTPTPAPTQAPTRKAPARQTPQQSPSRPSAPRPHTDPRRSVPTAPTAQTTNTSEIKTAQAAQCRHCDATALTGKWGRYGYYWSCQQCDGNTPMPLICEACGHEGKRGEGVKIRKDGDRYFRACDQCGVEHGFWTQAG